jgi:hypothetical protein
MTRKQKTVATMLITLIASSSMISDYNTVRSDAVVESTGMNPGMAVRLEQATFVAFKNAMQDFLPNYIEHDFGLPTEYDYQVGLEAGPLTDFLTWKYHWTDIKYTDANFDFRDVKLVLNRQFAEPMMKVDFPALREWKINALQTSNSWFLPESSYVELEFQDFDVDFNCDLELMESGFLKPVVYAIEIKFGNSYFYHDNALVAFVMNQFVEFAIVIIENSTYFVGKYIFTSMLGPLLTSVFDGYKMALPVRDLLPGQNNEDTFTLDYRNTMRPYIGDGWVDFYFLGETLYQEQGCKLAPSPMEFL